MSIARRFGGISLLLTMMACTVQPDTAPALGETIDEASAALDPWDSSEPAAAQTPCRTAARTEREVTRLLHAALRSWRHDHDLEALRHALASPLLLTGASIADVPPTLPGELCAGSYTLPFRPQHGGCLT